MIKLIPGRNNRKIYLQIDNLGELTERSIRHGFFDLGRSLQRSASADILRRPKSGRTYIIRTRSGRRRRHVASAPGETHANLTGTLRRSIGWQVRGHSEMEFGYGVDKDAPEWSVIENGTKTIKPRPSLRNAIERSDRNGENFFNRRFEDEL